MGNSNTAPTKTDPLMTDECWEAREKIRVVELVQFGILWYLTTIYDPKVFQLTKIKSEYSVNLYKDISPETKSRVIFFLSVVIYRNTLNQRQYVLYNTECPSEDGIAEGGFAKIYRLAH
jgi:hypothetical protein